MHENEAFDYNSFTGRIVKANIYSLYQRFLIDLKMRNYVIHIKEVRLSGRVLASGPVGPGIDTPPGHG